MAAVTSVVISAGMAGYSFAQAAKQNKLQRQAQEDANKAMAEARKSLEINYMDALAIQKEPYELARQAALSQGAMAIEAGRESERGAAATAGRVQMAQNVEQGNIRTEMGGELQRLAEMSAAEESRLRDVGVQLDLQEIAGAQQAMSDAEQAKAAYITQGVQSAASAAQTALETAPLYRESRAAKAMSGIEASYNKAAEQGLLGSQFMKDGKAIPYQQAVERMGKDLGLSGFEGVGSYNADQWNKWLKAQGAGAIKDMSRKFDWAGTYRAPEKTLTPSRIDQLAGAMSSARKAANPYDFYSDLTPSGIYGPRAIPRTGVSGEYLPYSFDVINPISGY